MEESNKKIRCTLEKMIAQKANRLHFINKHLDNINDHLDNNICSDDGRNQLNREKARYVEEKNKLMEQHLDYCKELESLQKKESNVQEIPVDNLPLTPTLSPKMVLDQTAHQKVYEIYFLNLLH
jgi:predicted  nucleic acid-binding Zn-ribbon protein